MFEVRCLFISLCLCYFSTCSSFNLKYLPKYHLANKLVTSKISRPQLELAAKDKKVEASVSDKSDKPNPFDAITKAGLAGSITFILYKIF